jgi:hypothetical protein
VSFSRRFGALASVLTATALLLAGCFVPPTIGEPEPSAVATDRPTDAPDVDAFEFVSFDALYTLGRDADGVSTLTTVETLVPVFPEYDQNRGIARSLPADYQGHSTEISVISVTDDDGSPRDFEIEREGDYVVIVMAVPEGQYVHGEQTYVLTYEQRRVIGDFATGLEFYWDVNGQWPQPFGTVSARLEIDPAIAADVVAADGCYFGPIGSTERCELQGGEGSYFAEVTDLGPGEGLTIAVGFAPGTFTG